MKIGRTSKKKHPVFIGSVIFLHLESRVVSQIKHQDVPEAVGYMEVEDYSSRTANLSWTPPYDGNSPITVYNIIYKTYRWTRIKKNNIERMLEVYWKHVEITPTRSSWTSAGREQVYGSVSQAVLKGLRPNTLVSWFCTFDTFSKYPSKLHQSQWGPGALKCHIVKHPY